jgi:hypothetical protein
MIPDLTPPKAEYGTPPAETLPLNRRQVFGGNVSNRRRPERVRCLGGRCDASDESSRLPDLEVAVVIQLRGFSTAA